MLDVADFGAGCVGGGAGVIVGHPFDTIKVRLQTQHGGSAIYRNAIHAFISICKKESGVTSPLGGICLINAITFGVQGNLVRYFADPQSVSAEFWAGSLAGAVQSIVCAPMELVKLRLQMQGINQSKAEMIANKSRLYRGPLSCLAMEYKSNGIRGVYRGFWITVLRETPSLGVYFFSYELLCRQMLFRLNEPMLTLPMMMISGGFAGQLAWLSTYPVDVIKTRLQYDGFDGRGFQFTSAWDCVKQTYRAGGYRVFYTGLSTTLVRAFPVNATTFTVYSLILNHFRPESRMRLEDITDNNGDLVTRKANDVNPADPKEANETDPVPHTDISGHYSRDSNSDRPALHVALDSLGVSDDHHWLKGSDKSNMPSPGTRHFF